MSDSNNFAAFLRKFPEVRLPVVLNDEIHHDFSQHNDPLSSQMIDRFLAPIETEPIDELTEFIACFKIPDTGEFHAVVYWKAALLNYQYVLATFTKTGVLVDKHVIAGLFSDGKNLTSSVATIDEDWGIHIVSGQTEAASSHLYDASQSKMSELELLPDGKIADA